MHPMNAANDDASEPTTTVAGPQVYVTVTVNNFKITISKRNLEHFDAQDPYFFDSDYTIAGSTGFLLWEANWLLLRLLRSTPLPIDGACSTRSDPPDGAGAPSAERPRSAHDLGRLLAGRRVLDLGSGTGLAGLAAAACGAHVLLTDLSSVCEGALRANVQRNALASAAATATESEAPGASAAATGTTMSGAPGEAAAPGADEGAAVAGGGTEGQQRQPERRDAGPWAGAVRVGQGSAAVMPLDWTEPLEPQVRAGGNDPRDADFILAVDTIWLMDIFHAFIDVVLAVLSRGRVPSAAASAAAAAPPPLPPAGSEPSTFAPAQRQQQEPQQQQQPRACFMAFVERAGADSKLFVRKEAVERELRARGCVVETLVAVDVDVDGAARPGRVLRVTLAGTAGS
ncbi:hypothetical protein PLESTF_001417200 [Pleodorina starrii]|nr:hypothetical protein PLESTF_001417200 [Pleodorina starrii]